MKFTLIAETDDFKNTIEFEQDYLPHVLENIDSFLKGSGFVFDGRLEIVDE